MYIDAGITVIVQGQKCVQAIGGGRKTHMHQHPMGIQGLARAARGVFDGHAGDAIIANNINGAPAKADVQYFIAIGAFLKFLARAELGCGFDHKHLGGKLGEIERLDDARIAAAADSDRFIPVEPGIADRAVNDAFAFEARFGGHAQRLRDQSGGHNDDAGGIGGAIGEADRFGSGITLDLVHRANFEAGAGGFGLIRQLGA